MKLFFVLLLLGLSLSLPAQEEEKEDVKARNEKSIRLADELAAQGDSEGAEKVLERILRSDPENLELLTRLAGIQLQSGRTKEALPYLRKMLELGDKKEADYFTLGRILIDIGEFEDSVSILREGAERFSTSPEFPYLLTYALSNLQRWAEAIAEFEKTKLLATGEKTALLDERFYFKYGAAHERLGNHEEAVKFLRKSLAITDQTSDSDAETEFQATLLNYLAYMWVERGENLKEAGEFAKRAAGLSPESGAIADTVGWFHFQNANYPRALVELKKAERLIEEPDPVIYDHLGQTLAKLEEKAFAAEYFRKALELDPDNEEIKSRLAEVEE